MFVSCERCVLSGRGHCDGLVNLQRSPTECDVCLKCDREASTKRRGPGPYKAVEPYKKKRQGQRRIYDLQNLEEILFRVWYI